MKEKIIPAHHKDVHDPANRGGGAEELKKAPLNQKGASHEGKTPDKKPFREKEISDAQEENTEGDFGGYTSIDKPGKE